MYKECACITRQTDGVNNGKRHIEKYLLLLLQCWFATHTVEFSS